MSETEGVGEAASESTASLSCVPSHKEIPAYRMEPMASAEHVEGFRRFSLGLETAMAQARKNMMDHGFLTMRGLCAAWRVNPRILCATQFGTRVIMPGDEGLQES